MKSFNSYLEERILEKNSHLCVGLDIAVESFPGADPDLDFLKAHAKKVIDATRELAVAYKPNLGFFERWGSKGFEWMEMRKEETSEILQSNMQNLCLITLDSMR